MNDGLADLYESRTSTELTLETIVEWASQAVDCDNAGIFLLRGRGKVETVVPTTRAVSEAHELQLDLSEGPCLEVLREDNVGAYIVGDTETDPRFPKWGPKAAELGLHSVISVALDAGDKSIGSLNVYSRQPHKFTREDLAVIDIFSHRAARALAVAQERVELVKALDTRKLIGQAQGILMERFDLDSDASFSYLVRQSQSRNVKLRSIAEWIVSNRSDRRSLDQIES